MGEPLSLALSLRQVAKSSSVPLVTYSKITSPNPLTQNRNPLSSRSRVPSSFLPSASRSRRYPSTASDRVKAGKHSSSAPSVSRNIYVVMIGFVCGNLPRRSELPSPLKDFQRLSFREGFWHCDPHHEVGKNTACHRWHKDSHK